MLRLERDLEKAKQRHAKLTVAGMMIKRAIDEDHKMKQKAEEDAIDLEEEIPEEAVATAEDRAVKAKILEDEKTARLLAQGIPARFAAYRAGLAQKAKDTHRDGTQAKKSKPTAPEEVQPPTGGAGCSTDDPVKDAQALRREELAAASAKCAQGLIEEEEKEKAKLKKSADGGKGKVPKAKAKKTPRG